MEVAGPCRLSAYTVEALAVVAEVVLRAAVEEAVGVERSPLLTRGPLPHAGALGRGLAHQVEAAAVDKALAVEVDRTDCRTASAGDSTAVAVAAEVGVVEGEAEALVAAGEGEPADIAVVEEAIVGCHSPTAPRRSHNLRPGPAVRLRGRHSHGLAPGTAVHRAVRLEV